MAALPIPEIQNNTKLSISLPGSICHVCGSSEVSISDGHGFCHECLSKMTYTCTISWTPPISLGLKGIEIISKNDDIIESRFDILDL